MGDQFLRYKHSLEATIVLFINLKTLYIVPGLISVVTQSALMILFKYLIQLFYFILFTHKRWACLDKKKGHRQLSST